MVALGKPRATSVLSLATLDQQTIYFINQSYGGIRDSRCITIDDKLDLHPKLT
ncbi:hypothetical protein DPMN_001281 [Dreissena polymorpha]|uniref:Uncharacterized protein n=1 Tax=Dreissena polymorpha TaxID=45954 RepID=A0A9D4RSX1_DREPO|nr:hypothetical protein DPMN_001262 [Dreissena polymorpha]KAH3877415.1 hypothetical protein DPMN_001281 [Dreissena polymorpha]